MQAPAVETAVQASATVPLKHLAQRTAEASLQELHAMLVRGRDA